MLGYHGMDGAMMLPHWGQVWEAGLEAKHCRARERDYQTLSLGINRGSKQGIPK